MTLTFKKALEEERKKYAYWLGTREFYNIMVKQQVPPMMLVSPFEKGTKEDVDWLDGYMDAFFLHYGHD